MNQDTPSSRSFRPNLEVWWLNPVWTVLLMAALLLPASYLIPDWMFREYWRMPKLIDLQVINTCLWVVAAFVVGAFAGNTRPHTINTEGRYAWTQDLPWPFLLQMFNWSFYLTVFGYLAWAASAVARGVSLQLILGVLQGAQEAGALMKSQYLVTISGVTTMTQFGLVGVVLGATIGCIHGWKHVRVKVALIMFLAIVRAVLNSERLAVIELAIPLALVVIRLAILDSPRVIGTLRLLVITGPVYAGGALLAMFGASEYFRSWLNFYAGHSNLTFPQFASLRLLGYYVTAINNGALLVQRFEPTGAPFFTAHFLWRFPILSSIVTTLYPQLPFSNVDDPYTTILGVGANAEFNNGDGYLLPIIDFGFFGAMLYWFTMGLICGWLYRMFCRKHPLGLFIYPLVFIGVTEMPRVIYWGEGRVVPAFIALGLIAYYCTSFRARAQQLSALKLQVLREPAHP